MNKPLFTPDRVPRTDQLCILTKAQHGKPVGLLEVLSAMWVWHSSGIRHDSQGNREALPSMGEALPGAPRVTSGPLLAPVSSPLLLLYLIQGRDFVDLVSFDNFLGLCF